MRFDGAKNLSTKFYTAINKLIYDTKKNKNR